MSQDNYDLLVRGVKEFQEIAQEQAPMLGVVLNKQLDKLQSELQDTPYGKKINISLKTMKLEAVIRDFIRQYRPQLINMVNQHNPYMERGVLTQFVHRPIFFKILKEEKELFFDFERAYKKGVEKYTELAAPLKGQPPLDEETLIVLAKNNYHRFRGVPTGGTRPKRLIPISKVFKTHLDENYYRYNGKPMAFIRLDPYGLVGVFNLETAELFLHVSQTGRMSPKWEKYAYPRKHAWAIHASVVRLALARALRNNEATPLPLKEAVTDAKKTAPVQNQQRRTSAIDAIRKKLATMVKASYYDPKKHRVDVMVPVTKTGSYCDIASRHAVRLLIYEIHSDAPEEHKATARQLFRDILPYALVVNPGEAFPLRDFLRFVPKPTTVKWMSEHIRPMPRP